MAMKLVMNYVMFVDLPLALQDPSPRTVDSRGM